MKLVETVFLNGRPLGRITWDDFAHQATFSPHHNSNALKPLADELWSCPVECREAVRAFAQTLEECRHG